MRSSTTTTARNTRLGRNVPSASRPPRRSAPRSASLPTYSSHYRIVSRDSDDAAAGADAIQLLKDDHRRVEKLLQQLVRAEGAAQPMLLWQLEQLLRAHALIEEQVFYPAFRQAAHNDHDRDAQTEASAEHAIIDTILALLTEAEEDEFAARARVLRRAVLHHIAEEERTILPRARRLLGADELKRLGVEMTNRKHLQDQRSERLQNILTLH